MAPRKQFLLRMDPQLWREVEQWAGEELRSVNGQIEYILREAVRRRTGRVPPATGDVTRSQPDEGAQPDGADVTPGD
jgi:hypothetical protein